MSSTTARAKICSLEEAVADNLGSGCSAAFEGFTHLIPYAAAHEAIRQGARGLTLFRMTPDVIYDQLIGVGAVDKLVFSYAGNPGVGLLHRFRDAVENKWPRRLEIEEHSHAALANMYEAAASGMPFAAFRGYIGADLQKVNPNIKSIECPFTGEVLSAVPAVQLDVAFIHAQKADRDGNVLLQGIVGVQKEAVLAAKRAVVTVEEIVDDLNAHPNACVLPSWVLSAVACVPGGAHPSYAQGYYSRDNGYYLEWAKISADREAFQSWVETSVLQATPGEFGARAYKSASKR
ncbi:MAG: hypothetical protein OXC26_15545 [Albidovulum sp.]|nr:hypothetical protein [Albidovulum sp.]